MLTPRPLLLAACSVALLAIAPQAPAAQRAAAAIAGDRVRGQPYRAYTVVDNLERTVEFFVSELDHTDRLPLIVFVHGSGHASHFTREGERIGPANGHASLQDVARGRARVVIVEKPGVSRFDRASSPATAYFRQEHTLDRWVAAVSAVVRAATQLPNIDASRLLLIGHSEGGLVAARVAALPRVSHVALLAGGGPSQLFDLLALARDGAFFAPVASGADQRVAWVHAQWDSILADPSSADREFFGHPFRRWSSFLADSPIVALRATDARVFVAQGANDPVVTRASFDALVAELLATGRRPHVRLVADADHSFRVTRTDGSVQDAWPSVLSAIVDWYLSDPSSGRSVPLLARFVPDAPR